jgi:hypothetical protein
MYSGAVGMMWIQRRILSDLWEWDRNVLGELEKRINKVKKELEKCRRARLTQENVNQEHVLRYQLDRLLDQQHIYWKQRAHPLWLLKGDRNTKYFHVCASERKRRNNIKALREDGGDVIEGSTLKLFITNHYKSLFSSHAGSIMEVVQKVKMRVSKTMNEALLKTFTAEEVEEALNGIGDLKAPGPDGIPSIFYKRFWKLVGEQVKRRFLQC